MTDCQLTEPFAECGPVQTMRHNADFWYRLCQREKKKREQLEREADWLAERSPEMYAYRGCFCAYAFMPQNKKCPRWTASEDGDVPEDESLEAWKRCVFGEKPHTEPVNCGTHWAKCWREAARQAVERAEKETK